MGNAACGLAPRPADVGPSGCRQDISNRKGRRITASACRELLVNGGDRQLIAALAANIQALTRRSFMSNETMIYDFSKAGDVELLKVVARYVREHWREVLSAGELALATGAAPCAESVLSALVSRPASRGRTPLMAACATGHTATVKQLLSMGADAWAVAHNCTRTALHTAVLSGHTECVAALLEAVQDDEQRSAEGHRYVDVRSLTGYTALHYAAAMGNHNMVEVLVNRHTADLVVYTRFETHEMSVMFEVGSTPLHMAALLGDERTAAVLCKAFAARRANDHRLRDPRTARDCSGAAPCQVALARKHKQLAHMLSPDTDLLAFFKGAVRPVGVPRLAALAAAAMSAHLTGQITALVPQGEQQQQEQPSAATTPASGEQLAENLSGMCGSCKGDRCSSTSNSSSSDSVCNDSAVSCGDCSSSSGGGSACGDSDSVCGVCLDASHTLSIVSCGHRLCTPCALQLCKPPVPQQRQAQLQPAGCPFCRRAIRGWAAL